MNTLFIGNLISLLGCFLMVSIGFLRKRNHILMAQCFQFGLLGLANLILGATSGFISGIVGITRNLVFSKFRSTRGLKIFFIVLQIALSLPFVGNGLIDFFPILAAVMFTLCIDTRSETVLKVFIILAQLFWLVFDFYYRNYTAMAFDGFTVLSNLIGIFLIRRHK